MGTVIVNDELKLVARTALLLFGAHVLQLGLFSDLGLFSVHPEVLLAIGAGSAITWGRERGAVVGFTAGLLADLSLSGRFGITALAWGISCYGLGVLSEGLARRSRVVDAVLMGVGGATGVIAFVLAAALFGQPTLGDDNLLVIIGMVSFWNMILSPAVLPLCRWAGRHPELRVAR